MKKQLTTTSLFDIIIIENNKGGIKMDFTLHIEETSNNEIKISSNIGATRYYEIDNWLLESAIVNYINDEIL